MAQFQASQPLEGLSTIKPPFFDGPYVPMKVVGENEVPKEEAEWNDEDLEVIKINHKVINMLQFDGGVEVVEEKMNIAFKASKQKEESQDDASDDESSHEEDITKLVLKEVKKYMKSSLKGKSSRRNKEIHYSRGKIYSDDEDRGKLSEKHIKCYKCNEIGQYRNQCPQLKKGERKDKKSMKKKAFVATWSDDETSSMESESSLENGVTNLCFMA
ncbi:hypothetical protein SLEP1_g6590 [Rubroshorea leprosula]|uniref:CCHC-type domain-containing protein n=1 Tax=Rubroshorea leprosula TaxID=152421 RepID=A0AAV5I223_9ROSI|nr:hypothetical protein SLEP1_g6590 [Rubroshorea leprosula]